MDDKNNFLVKTKTYPESTHKNVPKNAPTDIVAKKVKFMTHPNEEGLARKAQTGMHLFSCIIPKSISGRFMVSV